MMDSNLSGLSTINLELTSRCNKNCWMCGRRKVDREYPELKLNYGDMNFDLIEKISKQVPPNIVVQFHNNGEGLLYPRFGDAVRLFDKQIKNIVSNGKLLIEKSGEIINNLDTITISVFENDPEADEQYEILKEFLKLKGEKKPFVVLRLNGDVNSEKYRKLNTLIATRILHSPMGSYNYKKRVPTVPEAGICLDYMHHLAINKDGQASICVRFDPEGKGVIGDCNTTSLDEIWNSPKRKQWLEYHKKGRRDKIPLCSFCEFWGVPTGYH